MPHSTTICFHHPHEAEVAKIVELFRLDQRQAKDVSELLRNLVGVLLTQEATRESLNASAPKSESLSRLHRIQAALSVVAEELRGADKRTASLLKYACDYRASMHYRNALIKVFLKDTLFLDVGDSKR